MLSKRLKLLLAGVVALALVGAGTAIAASGRSAGNGPSPPPGITSINSHPIGTAGAATEGVGPMTYIGQ